MSAAQGVIARSVPGNHYFSWRFGQCYLVHQLTVGLVVALVVAHQFHVERLQLVDAHSHALLEPLLQDIQLLRIYPVLLSCRLFSLVFCYQVLIFLLPFLLLVLLLAAFTKLRLPPDLHVFEVDRGLVLVLVSTLHLAFDLVLHPDGLVVEVGHLLELLLLVAVLGLQFCELFSLLVEPVMPHSAVVAEDVPVRGHILEHLLLLVDLALVVLDVVVGSPNLVILGLDLLLGELDIVLVDLLGTLIEKSCRRWRHWQVFHFIHIHIASTGLAISSASSPSRCRFTGGARICSTLGTIKCSVGCFLKKPETSFSTMIARTTVRKSVM